MINIVFESANIMQEHDIEHLIKLGYGVGCIEINYGKSSNPEFREEIDFVHVTRPVQDYTEREKMHHKEQCLRMLLKKLNAEEAILYKNSGNTKRVILSDLETALLDNMPYLDEDSI